MGLLFKQSIRVYLVVILVFFFVLEVLFSTAKSNLDALPPVPFTEGICRPQLFFLLFAVHLGCRFELPGGAQSPYRSFSILREVHATPVFFAELLWRGPDLERRS